MGKRGRPRSQGLLTPREQEVLALVRDGLTNPQIADRLSISLEGVKYHVSEILSKLGVSTREEAAEWRPEQPWWVAVLSPLALLGRKSAWALGGAAIAAACGGLALLGFLLLRSSGGGSSRPLAALAPTATASPTATVLKPNPTGEIVGFQSVLFVDTQTGWASGYLGDRGAILATIDGGKTWREQYTNARPVAGLQFVNALVGWAVVYPLRGQWGDVPSVLLHTDDGGQHWVPIGDAIGNRTGDFLTSSLGRAISNGNLFETTDGGKTWKVVESSIRLDNMCFSDVDHGWAVGTGQIYRTSDGGRTWEPTPRPIPDPSTFEPKATATGIACVPRSGGAWAFFGGGVAAGGYWSATYRTIDGGSTWSPVLAHSYPQLHVSQQRGGPLALVDESTVYMASDCEPCLPTTNPVPVFRTTDGGTTWTDGSFIPGMAYASAIWFLDREHGWIAGFQNTGRYLEMTTPFLAATTDGGQTWTQQYP